MMLARLAEVLTDQCHLEPQTTIVAGISGGPDSLALLDVLHRLAFPVHVAHLDHGLRPESAGEAGKVRQMAEERGLAVTVERVDVADQAQELGLSIEEAARNARYHFLFNLAARVQAQAVAVAHTADDQVETVLMHLLRGAGLSGLKGMPVYSQPNAWSAHLPLVRPLLGVWRREVLAYCQENDLIPSQDPTNLDQRFFRNRLRHELLPFLETYNPNVRLTLFRTAEILGEDEAVLQEVVAAAWQACILSTGAGNVGFNLAALKALPTGIQRRLLRKGIELLRPGLRDIGFDAIQRALQFIASPSRSGQMELTAGLRLYHEDGQLFLAAWEAGLPASDWPQAPESAALELCSPGWVGLSGGWRLEAGPVPVEAARLDNPDPFQAWLDLAALQFPLVVRGYRPGERFQPLGMVSGSIKVSDFYTNRKLPRRARRLWPVVYSGTQVAWIPGFQMAHPYRIQPGTRQAVHLKLLRENS